MLKYIKCHLCEKVAGWGNNTMLLSSEVAVCMYTVRRKLKALILVGPRKTNNRLCYVEHSYVQLKYLQRKKYMSIY